jgi:hypothetical protein
VSDTLSVADWVWPEVGYADCIKQRGSLVCRKCVKVKWVWLEGVVVVIVHNGDVSDQGIDSHEDTEA